jgi:MFS family permease
MHPYLMQEIARQHLGDLRRAARQYGPAEPSSDRPVTAARTNHPGGEPMRSKPRILAALLLAAFLVNLDTTLMNAALPAMVRELHATTTQLQWVVDSISRAKAGVGSAVNDTTRLAGGTLGVAVIGSVYASVYGSRLTATMLASVPGRAAAIAHQSVGAAYAVAGKIAALGQAAAGQVLQHMAANAFLRGLTVGCLVAGAVAVGALLAVVFLPAQPAHGNALHVAATAQATAKRWGDQ